MSVYKADRTRQYIYIALLCAQGVIIGLLERMIPFPFAFAPGAKLGLANLITIISLFTMSIPDSFILMCLRLLLTTLLGGTLSTFLYSGAGAVLSWFGMLLIKQLGEKRVSMIGISAAGGILHNVGQLLMASFRHMRCRKPAISRRTRSTGPLSRRAPRLAVDEADGQYAGKIDNR